MFYLINKKTGISSFKAINDFAIENNITKIGHSGTLDPLASGLLLVATDEDTKLFNYINNKTKVYQVELQLGFQTDTYDIEGKVINETNEKIDNFNKIQQIFNTLVGKSKQIPPAFSAKKINGKRAYDLARKNQTIELAPVDIEVFSLTDIVFNTKNQLITFQIHVSNGTYIRSIVNDLGIKLKTYATMTKLRRIEISGLTLKDNNHNQIVTKLFENLLFVTKKDVKELILNHFNHIVNQPWYNNIIEMENKEIILIDHINFIIYGIIKIVDKKIKIIKLFGKRIF